MELQPRYKCVHWQVLQLHASINFCGVKHGDDGQIKCPSGLSCAWKQQATGSHLAMTPFSPVTKQAPTHHSCDCWQWWSSLVSQWIQLCTDTTSNRTSYSHDTISPFLSQMT